MTDEQRFGELSEKDKCALLKKYREGMKVTPNSYCREFFEKDAILTISKIKKEPDRVLVYLKGYENRGGYYCQRFTPCLSELFKEDV